MLFTYKAIAQQKGGAISILKGELESFQYSKVIMDADSIIKSGTKLSEKERVDINKMKGVAQFSLSDMVGAKLSFINILKIDNTFEFDSTDTSPKIIAFFNQVKNDYMQIYRSPNEIVKVDTVYVPKIIKDESSSEVIKQALIRSVIVPGLGHLYLNEGLKGAILTSLSVLTLGSSIYFIIDSNKKEDQYLNATDPAIIQSAYNKYNTSYKMKNISLISFAAIWIYSQIDILFFSGRDLLDNSSLQINTDGSSLRLSLEF